MFVIKKILAAFFIPPGLFVTILLLTGLVLWRKKMRKAALLNMGLSLVVWVFCLVPVSDGLVRGLESGLPAPRTGGADAVIVLSGYGDRTVPAIQLQKRLGVPILFSGYISLSHSVRDRENFYNLLSSWGVPRAKVILETKSRDTWENLRLARDICREKDFRQPVVVSSAFHGKRILLCLRKLRFEAVLYPVDFSVAGRTIRYSWRSALPDAQAVLGCSQAINEYFGLLIYRIFY